MTRVEIRRSVVMTGENPGMTLYDGEAVAVLSYWHCTDSPWGVGDALILWLKDAPGGGIFTDNPGLAQQLVERLTRHFPEFQGVAVDRLAYVEAQLGHVFDGDSYRVECRTPEGLLEAEWREPLDRKQVVWPGFPAGDAAYDLTTVIRPCGQARIRLGGTDVAGGPRLQTGADGYRSSSAFLAFAETWLGPVPA